MAIRECEDSISVSRVVPERGHPITKTGRFAVGGISAHQAKGE
jgi:hypothetical protein